MKKNQILFLMFFFITGISCKKEDRGSEISSLNFIHATVNIDNFAVSFAETPIPFYRNQSLIGFGSGHEYSLYPGERPISVLSSNDTTKIAWSGFLNLQPGKIYSFYLSGQAGHIDTLFREDLIPVLTDSSAGIRFVNLSPDSRAVSINIAGNSQPQEEFVNIGYKLISPFKNYPATGNVGGAYTFEVRDHLSGSLLTTFTWYYSLRRCNTVVIGGLQSAGINLFQVNNY